MNGKQIVLAVILAGFLALTGYALWVHELVEFVELLMANAVTVLLAADLTIALTLVMIWMWTDARDRGVSPVPYVLLTLTTGSAGPLLYLIRRESAGGMRRAVVGVPTR